MNNELSSSTSGYVGTRRVADGRVAQLRSLVLFEVILSDGILLPVIGDRKCKPEMVITRWKRHRTATNVVQVAYYEPLCRIKTNRGQTARNRLIVSIEVD